MFSTLPSLADNLYLASVYAPQVSSPLTSSPDRELPLSHDGKISQSARQPTIPMSSPIPSKGRKSNSYSKRITKHNPLIHHRDDGRETRRNLFFKKVRAESEERRWDARGGEDEMMRLIWLSEQKRRAEKQASDVTCIPSLQDEDDLGTNLLKEPPFNHTPNQDEEMANEFAQREDAEIEALVSFLEEDERGDHPVSQQSQDNLYGSDDEDYDNIFLGVLRRKEFQHIFSTQDEEYYSTSRKDRLEKAENDMMDMT